MLLLKSDYCFHLQKNNSYKREKFNLLGFKTIRCLEHVYACLDKKNAVCRLDCRYLLSAWNDIHTYICRYILHLKCCIYVVLQFTKEKCWGYIWWFTKLLIKSSKKCYDFLYTYSFWSNVVDDEIHLICWGWWYLEERIVLFKTELTA